MIQSHGKIEWFEKNENHSFRAKTPPQSIPPWLTGIMKSKMKWEGFQPGFNILWMYYFPTPTQPQAKLAFRFFF